MDDGLLSAGMEARRGATDRTRAAGSQQRAGAREGPPRALGDAPGAEVGRRADGGRGGRQRGSGGWLLME